METNREVLIWFHQRLVEVHKERETYDYMHRLRNIIMATSPTKISRSKSSNNIQECYQQLKRKTYLEKAWLQNLV